MKITAELQNKINRLLDEKYSNRIKELQKKRDEFDTSFMDDEVGKIFKSVSENKYFEKYIRDNKYSGTSIRDYISVNISRFVELPKNPIDAELSKLKNQKKIDKGNILIAISYEKTIDGIKKAFDDAGLDF